MMERIAVLAGRRLKLRGVGRVLSLLYPRGMTSPRYVVGVRRRDDGLMFESDSREVIDWETLFRGMYEPHLRELFGRLVKCGDVVADVGANVGAHSLTLAGLVGSGGKVMAFEPNPTSRTKLSRNLNLNGFDQVKVFSCGLGAREAELRLRVPRGNTAEASNSGLASFFALDVPHDLVPVRVRPFDLIEEIQGLDRLDLVKMDVQGFEEHVLTGMVESLRKHRPIIVFEYEEWAWACSDSNWERVKTLLGSLDYQLFGFGRRGKYGLLPLESHQLISGHADVVAIHRCDPRRQVIVS